MPTRGAINKGETATTSETISTGSGVKLDVERRLSPHKVELILHARTAKDFVLHWGVRIKGRGGWSSVPASLWPEGTTAAGPNAMQTPFPRNNAEGRVVIRLDRAAALEAIEFVLFFPSDARWDNNGRRNYQIALSNGKAARADLSEMLKARLKSAKILFERKFDLPDAGSLTLALTETEDNYQVVALSDIPAPLIFHWGIAWKLPQEWAEPPESWRLPASTQRAGNSAETSFETREGLRELQLTIPKSEAPLGIQFVLKQGSGDRWLKYQHGNFYIPVRDSSKPAGELSIGQLGEMANRIIQPETGNGSWTLMHRFNLCFDLLEQAKGNNEALALLYVWLRFSAIRQLTWQRNYNTKPRELAHAQDRLTGRLADLYRTEREARPIIRQMLATIGRGGDGQRIRDEILHIMHRHHVKEVTGHFLEEWHQKLHNNTTPDDIVICDAYLEFLRSNGNLDRFYQTLQNGGVTRERLASFERPIRTQPDFVGHLKDALIPDFEHFLKILKAVHSGTDLETALNAARDQLDGGTQELMWRVWNHRHEPAEGVVTLVQNITEARHRLAHLLNDGQQHRQVIYLDLALEQLVRTAVERNLHHHLQAEQLAELIARVIENVMLSQENVELSACLRHWDKLIHGAGDARFGVEWSLHAKSVVDRVGRALSASTDQVYQLLQPKAQFLGGAFGAEAWTISLFSEEVVRGSSLGFSLSMLLQQLGRILRGRANLGAWEIVSRGRGTGKVEVVENLRTVQGKEFKEPIVLITDKVTGDEELPKEIVAVIAPNVTDLVSHVAVRARNSQMLFASCSDPDVLAHLKSRRGQFLSLEVTPSGEVLFKDAVQAERTTAKARVDRLQSKLEAPRFSKFVITLDQFNEKVVGSKSLSQARLQGKLPPWVKQPASVALPFGCFEKALSLEENKETARRYEGFVRQFEQNRNSETLVSLQKQVMELVAPDELKRELRESFDRSGMTFPEDWEAAWRCIKQVWASKWNERAVLSRKKMGLKDEALFMAVLVQPVVPADYAFVLHTVNPSTDNPAELYGEVVLGLGETLVGNFQGRALGFVWQKQAQQARLVSYPSKSVGLYDGGLIFRSDSNGEDLAGFAGAGLYDSVLLNAPREVSLDYSEEPLVWNSPLREGILAAIGRIGAAVEKEFGSPQDIEGVLAKGEYFIVQSRPQVGLGNQ